MQIFSLVCCGNPHIPWRKDTDLIHKKKIRKTIDLKSQGQLKGLMPNDSWGGLVVSRALFHNLHLSFLNLILYFSYQVATQLCSWGCVHPVPEQFLGYSWEMNVIALDRVRHTYHYTTESVNKLHYSSRNKIFYGSFSIFLASSSTSIWMLTYHLGGTPGELSEELVT